MPEQNYTNRIKGKTILQIISAIIIPLLIAIATIFITIQQNELNKANRANDLDIAQKQRDQDLLIANKTREQDRELNTRQRHQEQVLAEQQRQESLFDNYIREISQLLLSLNFTLTYTIREFIIRPQTLAVLSQLDTKRKTNIILFLLESGLIISGNNPISLVGANLDGLNLDIEEDNNFHSYLFYLALPRTSLIDASFNNRQLRYADFRYTQMRNASFQGATLLSAEFCMADLRNSTFSKADLREVDFSLADLTGSDLSDEQLHKQSLTLAGAILPDGITRGQAPNVVVNGNAELGSMFGWNLTNTTYVVVKKYKNQTNPKYGKWYFQTLSKDMMISMWQRINLSRYSNMIKRGGIHIVLSMEMKPLYAQPSILVRTFTDDNSEILNERESLTNLEVENGFLYASGLVPCHRNTNSIEVTIKILATELIDNINISIEHAGHSTE